MTEGFLIYRCRLCDRTYRRVQVPDVDLALASVVVAGRTPKSWGIALIRDVHACDGVNRGIADLQGGAAGHLPGATGDPVDRVPETP